MRKQTSILLVNPNIVNDKTILGKSFGFSFVFNRIPSIGLGYLASAVESSDRNVMIYDPILPKSESDLLNVAAINRPNIIGFYSTALYMATIKKVIQKLKESAGWNFLTVIGGPQVSSLPEEAMRYTGADIGVIGEGENTLKELVERIENGERAFDGVLGTIIRRGGEFFINPPRPLIENLEEMRPAWDLMPPFETWRPTPASYRKLPLAVVVASRGCPYQCTFCDRAVFGNKYRFRSGEALHQEVKELVERYNVKEVRFFDDAFAENKKRVIDFCEFVKSRGPKILWTCLLTVRSAHEKLLKTMREAGCWQVLFGLENASNEILRRLKKPQTVEQIKEAVALAKRAGLRVRADFLVGTPGDTAKNMFKTVEFAKRLKVDMAHFNKFTPFPGSELYRELTDAGYNFSFDMSWNDLNHKEHTYVPEGLTPEQYTKLLGVLYRKFYLRLGYIFRRLLSLRSWDEFKGHVRGLLSMISL